MKFIDHVKNIVEIDDQCFVDYFNNFNEINKFLEKDNTKKSKLSVFLDQKFNLSEKKLTSNLKKNTKSFTESFIKRGVYFFHMNWGFETKQEMFDTYDHVSRKLKFENSASNQTTKNFNANKSLLKSIILFEETKEKILQQPQHIQGQYLAQLELSFAGQVATYNHLRGTSYSTQHFKLSH